MHACLAILILLTCVSLSLLEICTHTNFVENSPLWILPLAWTDTFFSQTKMGEITERKRHLTSIKVFVWVNDPENHIWNINNNTSITIQSIENFFCNRQIIPTRKPFIVFEREMTFVLICLSSLEVICSKKHWNYNNFHFWHIKCVKKLIIMIILVSQHLVFPSTEW